MSGKEILQESMRSSIKQTTELYKEQYISMIQDKDKTGTFGVIVIQN